MLAHNLRSYAANLLVIWGLVGFYLYGIFYPRWLSPAAKLILVASAIGYTLYGLVRYVFLPGDREHDSNGWLAWQAARHFVTHRQLPEGSPQHPQTTALLFLGVKAVFIPAMINFCLSNTADILRFWDASNFDVLEAEMLAGPVFQLILAVFFMVDTLYFTCGYLVDSVRLGTQVRSVEPTLLGWGSALICYPPFNNLLGKLGVGWYSADTQHFAQPELDLIVRVFLVILFATYLAATLALGTRCSNLTNRGVVARGPYAYIRHPAYATKVLGWWLFMLPVISPAAVASVFLWTVIYYLRAVTEEQHLSRDGEYQAYCVAVKHRFVPGVW
ncbi:MAG: DUF1295 domain-containing protein [Bryobacteraceae bacterium]|nr:DUF1295 domain-containing protein [Bryobacteraceae bacterium]